MEKLTFFVSIGNICLQEEIELSSQNAFFLKDLRPQVLKTINKK